MNELDALIETMARKNVIIGGKQATIDALVEALEGAEEAVNALDEDGRFLTTQYEISNAIKLAKGQK